MDPPLYLVDILLIEGPKRCFLVILQSIHNSIQLWAQKADCILLSSNIDKLVIYNIVLKHREKHNIE